MTSANNKKHKHCRPRNSQIVWEQPSASLHADTAGTSVTLVAVCLLDVVPDAFHPLVARLVQVP